MEEGAAAGRDMTDSQALLDLMATDPAAAQVQIDKTVQFGQQIGALEATGGATGLASAKTEILEDGTVVQALPSGVVEVRNRAGELVTGQARLDALDAAAQARQTRLDQEATRITQEQQKRAADVFAQRLEKEPGIAQQTALAKASAKTASAAFDSLNKIQLNVANLQDAIDAVDAGASTGNIQSFFPDIRDASIELANIQNRLALDVVGATTFGALSAGELALAKSTALPRNLSGDALRKWLVDKQSAQRKLAAYFEEQAIFLNAGNSQADWITFKKEQVKQAEEAGGTAAGTPGELPTAVNAQTGETLTLKDGQWQ